MALNLKKSTGSLAKSSFPTTLPTDRTADVRNTQSVSFGAVTVRMTKPSAKIIQANIKAGQAALKRGKSAILSTGVTLSRQQGTPLYFGCEDRPGWMVRELDGKRTLGKFVGGRFRIEEDGGLAKQITTKA